MPAAEEQQAVAEEGPADADASSSTSPTRKRARVVVAGGDGEDTAAASTGAGGAVKVLRDTLLEATRVAALRDQYPNAVGYPHCVVQDVLDGRFFRSLREEMVGALSANFKETDLFKLFQTGDLANLDAGDPEMATRLPHLLALREAIYSPSFRRFVADITGCAPLTDRTDCSSNLYTQGCHLLCHDDVIGTRCISFIIYLTDPDELWAPTDGGALEIYPLSEAGKLGTPAVQPVTTHLPLPNTMVVFTVLPGQSFHAVEEVYPPGKMRLSISGWYHAAAPPPGADKASLNQLQTREAEARVTVVPLPSPLPSPIIDAPRSSSSSGIEDEEKAAVALLGKWINPAYLAPGAMQQIRARFEAEDSILLHDFLLPAMATEIREAALARDKADEVGRGRKPADGVGVGHGWEPVGPPHKQRYLRFSSSSHTASSPSSSVCPVGELLAAVRDELFASPEFASYLAALTGHAPGSVSGECCRFRPGLDYTLAHYGLLRPEPRLDASLCCAVAEGTKRQARRWGSGDVGGFLCYIKADLGQEDKAEAAESYRRPDREARGQGDEEVLSVFASSNALSLVLRRPNAMRFVKYVSASAPSSRWDVAAEYGLLRVTTG